MPKDKDKIAMYSKMSAPIFLHSDVIDEYPLHKLNEREFVLSPILQSMIPTLRKNPDVMWQKSINSMTEMTKLQKELQF